MTIARVSTAGTTERQCDAWKESIIRVYCCLQESTLGQGGTAKAPGGKSWLAGCRDDANLKKLPQRRKGRLSLANSKRVSTPGQAWSGAHDRLVIEYMEHLIDRADASLCYFQHPGPVATEALEALSRQRTVRIWPATLTPSVSWSSRR